MIPTFPDFVNLNFSHREEINKITKDHHPYSDYNFVSLWCYDTKNNLSLSLLNKNLVIKFTDYITIKNFFSFYGNNKFEESCLDLLKLSKKNNFEPFLKLIPATFINHKVVYKKIKIREDRDNFDYIYSLDTLSRLPGKKFEKIRRLHHRFIRNYPSFQVKELDLTHVLVKKQIIDVFYLWAKLKKKGKSEIENELISLKKLLTHSHKFNLVSTGIYIDDILVGFTLNEIIHKYYAMGHFAKSDHNFEGMNETLKKYTSDILISRNCKYINWEQDMGLENLRYAKNLWQPSFFLKKYIIEKR